MNQKLWSKRQKGKDSREKDEITLNTHLGYEYQPGITPSAASQPGVLQSKTPGHQGTRQFRGQIDQQAESQKEEVIFLISHSH